MGSDGRDSNKTKPAQKDKTKTKDINLSSNNIEASYFSFPEEPRECMGSDGRVLWAPKLEYKENKNKYEEIDFFVSTYSIFILER